MVEIEKNYESSTFSHRLMRQVRGDQEQVNWTDKAPQSKRNSSRSQSQRNGKESSRKQSELPTVRRNRVTQEKRVVHFSLSISAKNVAKKGT